MSEKLLAKLRANAKKRGALNLRYGKKKISWKTYQKKDKSLTQQMNSIMRKLGLA